MVFDVRFLPNPNFVPLLKDYDGQTETGAGVREEKGLSAVFLRKVSGLLDFLLPLYTQEGKNYLTIAIGCTGGRHRSVAVAEFLKDRMKGKGLDITVRHRDIER